MAASGEAVTYGQLESRSNQGAHLLRRLGVRAGDAVALFLDNHPDFFELVWAVERIGAYYAMIPSRLTAVEARYILEDCGARVLIVSPAVEHAAALASLAPQVQSFSIGGALPGLRDWIAARAVEPAVPVPDEEPGGDMLYTGGTTGRPKGVRASRPAQSRLDRETRLSEIGRKHYGLSSDTVYLSPAPLYHGAPLRWSMTVQRLGGTVVVMERFDAEAALAAIEKHRVTHAQWVPTHLHRMLSLPRQTKERYDLSSMRLHFHAAAPCPVPLKERMLEWWGPIIHEYYSSTESSGFCTIGPQEWLAHKGSVGRALVGAIRICDERGEPLPPGERGVVYFEGAPAFEYHNDPHKTAASRNRHGWATIGDLGWVDAEGYLYLVDRQGFMVITGGVNVYPQEIENVLASHPAVADAAVFGLPDDDLGERVVAVVQPREWGDAGDALADELMRFMSASLSAVKRPKRIEFRERLPRYATGKLHKGLLRDEYRAAAAAAKH